jgi:hypothetical protein
VREINEFAENTIKPSPPFSILLGAVTERKSNATRSSPEGNSDPRPAESKIPEDESADENDLAANHDALPYRERTGAIILRVIPFQPNARIAHTRNRQTAAFILFPIVLFLARERTMRLSGGIDWGCWRTMTNMRLKRGGVTVPRCLQNG